MQTTPFSALTNFQKGISNASALSQKALPSKLSGSQANMADQAKEFEQVFLKSMLENMFESVKGEGPLGGENTATSTWRSMMVDEYATAMSDKGGIGLADQMLKQMLHLQEAAQS